MKDKFVFCSKVYSNKIDEEIKKNNSRTLFVIMIS